MKLAVDGRGLRCQALTKRARCPHDAEYVGLDGSLRCHAHADRTRQRKLTRDQRLALIATHGEPVPPKPQQGSLL